MYETARKTWLDFVETYKEMRCLWDPKDEHRNNKFLRGVAFDKLLKTYKKIDENASLADMKNRITNMRTTYNREKKKYLESVQNGDTDVYKPTLWYYDVFSSFLDSDTEGISSFNTLKNFKGTMSIQRPPKRERESLRLEMSSNVNNKSVAEEEEQEEEEEETPQPVQKRRRIYNLLQKQERFVDQASQMLVRKEEEWEIQGKAIALQLYQLKGLQRAIAQKLVSDAIFFGSLDQLTVDSFIHVNNRQESPEIHEDIDYLEEESDN